MGLTEDSVVVAVVRSFAVVVNSELVYKTVIEPRHDLFSMN